MELSIDSVQEFIKRENEMHLRRRTPKKANAILVCNLNALDVALMLSFSLLALMGAACSAFYSWSLIPGLTLILVVTVVALSFLFNPWFMDSLFLTSVGTVVLCCGGFSFSPSTGGAMLFGICALGFIVQLARARRTTLEMLDAKFAEGRRTVQEVNGEVTPSVDRN
jgi:hypothetical protein